MTELEKLAIKRIYELATDGYMAVVRNHKDMGQFAVADSGFDKVCAPLTEIQLWASALRGNRP